MRVCSVISGHLVRSFTQAGEKGTGSLYFPSLCNDYSTKDLRQEIEVPVSCNFERVRQQGSLWSPVFDVSGQGVRSSVLPGGQKKL